jgi:hypothetical protein
MELLAEMQAASDSGQHQSVAAEPVVQEGFNVNRRRLFGEQAAVIAAGPVAGVQSGRNDALKRSRRRNKS